MSAYTETTKVSWFSRIKNAFGGIFFGILLFLVAFPLIFWNEGRAVKTAKSLKEGAGIVVSVSADNVDPANDGKLVHMSGTAEPREVLRDDQFQIEDTAIKLERKVEMYQWKENQKTETERKVGGSEERKTTYTYEKTWSGNLIDSGSFKQPDGRSNPSSMPWSSETFTSSDVELGAFKLNSSLIGSIGNYQARGVTDEDLAKLPEGTRKDMQVHGNGFYKGANPSDPQIGDVRISFRIVPATVVSILAQQQGNTFQAYQTKAGDAISRLVTSQMSAEEMFKQAQDQNKMMTWLIRIGSFLMMYIGLSMVLNPIKVLADVLPFLGNIVGAGLGMISGLVAFAFWTVTVALAWILYRPLLGILLLIATGAAIYGIINLIKKHKSAEPKPEEQPA